MFRAIVNFRIGALIQSNVIGRNYTSKQGLQYCYFPDKPWILLLRKVKENIKELSSEELKWPLTELWKEHKEPLKYKSREIREKTQSNILSSSKEEQEKILKLQDDIQIKTKICKKFFKDKNRPCYPVQPHEMYFQEKHPRKSRRDAKDEFDKLSDEEKQPFIDKFDEKLKFYFIDLKKWKEIHAEAYKEIKKMLEEIEKLKGELNRYYYKYKHDLQN